MEGITSAYKVLNTLYSLYKVLNTLYSLCILLDEPKDVEKMSQYFAPLTSLCLPKEKEKKS